MIAKARALTALAVVALGIAACGGSSSSATKAFTGSTSQGLPISFTVTGALVQSLEFEWRAKCADGQVHTNAIILGNAALQSGTFALGATLDTGAYAHANGTVNGASAAGQLSRSGPSAFGTNCLDTGVTWTAHASG